jgi:hypothetical protein
MTDPVQNPTPENNPPENNAPENVSPADVSNDNAATAAPAKTSRMKGLLKAVFNMNSLRDMAAGAAVTAIARTTVISIATWAAAPAAATLIFSALAVGAATAIYTHVKENKKAEHKEDLLSRKNMKRFLKSSAFALVGGALFLGFTEGVFGNWANGVKEFFAAAPKAEIPPAPVEVIPEPVVVAAAPPCLTATEAFADSVKDIEVSDRVNDAINKLSSTRPSVAAQAAKDLAYYSFNGLDGVPKNESLALELYAKAADAGSLQARTDLAYIQYHGLAGVNASPAEAFKAVSNIETHQALVLTEEWRNAAGGSGFEAAQPGAKFDAQAIVAKAIQPRCPTL